jgi:hypothetical protein
MISWAIWALGGFFDSKGRLTFSTFLCETYPPSVTASLGKERLCGHVVDIESEGQRVDWDGRVVKYDYPTEGYVLEFTST